MLFFLSCDDHACGDDAASADDDGADDKDNDGKRWRPLLPEPTSAILDYIMI